MITGYIWWYQQSSVTVCLICIRWYIDVWKYNCVILYHALQLEQMWKFWTILFGDPDLFHRMYRVTSLHRENHTMSVIPATVNNLAIPSLVSHNWHAILIHHLKTKWKLGGESRDFGVMQLGQSSLWVCWLGLTCRMTFAFVCYANNCFTGWKKNYQKSTKTSFLEMSYISSCWW